jgi:integrase
LKGDLPLQTERERRYLTHAELLTLASAMGPFETLTLVLGCCSVRFGEAVALRRRHVGDRELTIGASATAVTGKGIVESTTKTKRDRHVPVPAPVWVRLKEELPSDPSALIFRPRRVGHLALGEFGWAFDRGCAVVGIEGLTPQGLRHTTASLAIQAQANVKVVQRLLGHATAAMTLDRHGHLFNDDLTKVADLLGAAIDSAAVSLRYAQPGTAVTSG